MANVTGTFRVQRISDETDTTGAASSEDCHSRISSLFTSENGSAPRAPPNKRRRLNEDVEVKFAEPQPQLDLPLVDLHIEIVRNC